MRRATADNRNLGQGYSTAIGGMAGSNLTFRIMEDLGIAIVTEHYSEANPFPIEASLCEKYGVSRAVLREAVKMLTAKGLLSARPRHGTWVQPEKNWNFFDPDVLRWLLERKLSYALLIEFTQVRMAVEPFAAGLAARYAGRNHIAAIMHALGRMSAAEHGEDDPLTSDIAFHVAIMKASGNRFYEQLCDMIDTALRISIRMTNHLKGVRQASVADHKKVADAIVLGDADAASAAMRVMIEEALDLIATAQANAERPPLLGSHAAANRLPAE
ncbi:MAG: FadR/GntR family transcriptional regulator [Rhizomicrobium sp.]|nr:FadR/GntR family transcriptional regulator [Rhizomicrobium sp.]